MSKGGGFKCFGSLREHSCRARKLTSKSNQVSTKKDKKPDRSRGVGNKRKPLPRVTSPLALLATSLSLRSGYWVSDSLSTTSAATAGQTCRALLYDLLQNKNKSLPSTSCQKYCPEKSHVCLPPSAMGPKKAPLRVLLCLLLSKNLTFHNANAFGGVIPPRVVVKL